jgi:hypothetical protein
MFRLLIWMYVSLAGGAVTQTPSPGDAVWQRAAREGTPLVDRSKTVVTFR